MESEMSHIIDYLSFDRSRQKFGTSPQEQIKGRDRLIKFNTISLLVTGIIFAASLTYTMMHPGFINGVITAGHGAAIIFTLKESILQAVTRHIERLQYKIEEEDASTTYGFGDFKKEIVGGLIRFKNLVCSCKKDDSIDPSTTTGTNPV